MMNKIKVIVQVVLLIFPIVIAIILPVDLLWLLVSVITNRDLDDVKTFVDNWFLSKKIIAILLGLVLSSLLFFGLRLLNKHKVYNTGSKYHDYNLIYYILAGSLLGYKTVSLVRVPLYLQFKIVFKDLFDNIVTDEHEEKKDSPRITVLNIDIKSNEINLILADTYKITMEDIPKEKRDLPTILIERDTGFSGIRTYNSKLTDAIREQTTQYRHNYTCVNIFATTNTMHTKEMILQSFKNAGRTGFQQVYVFEQNERYIYTKSHLIKD